MVLGAFMVAIGLCHVAFREDGELSERLQP